MNGLIASGEVHKVLRAFRRTARVSAETVAPLVNKKPSSLRAFERGERQWYPDLVRSYLEAVQQCVRDRSRNLDQEGTAIAQRFGGERPGGSAPSRAPRSPRERKGRRTREPAGTRS